MRVKQGMSCRRPLEFSPQVQPMIQTPAHGSLPSGHSTESFACALVLLRLLQASPINQHPLSPIIAPPPPPYPYPPQIDFRYGQQLMRIASRIAVNRTVAGVHFPVDSACGCLFGLTLGEYFVQRCITGAQYTSWHFKGDQFPNPNPAVINPPPVAPPDDGDFYWNSLFDVQGNGNQTPAPPYATTASVVSLQNDTPSIALPWLWRQALAEWT
jgi:hypothetical protein